MTEKRKPYKTYTKAFKLEQSGVGQLKRVSLRSLHKNIRVQNLRN